MTGERFNFQRNCVLEALDEPGAIVLNVGSNEDPAGLKALDTDRVINCDLEEFDSFLDGRPNRVDRVFDARGEWPFASDTAELVVLGDILEHLHPDEAEAVLLEANRVAKHLCITVPEDDRFTYDEQGVLESDTGYRTHCQIVTKEYLENILLDTGWTITDWHTVDYGFVPRGYFVSAERMF